MAADRRPTLELLPDYGGHVLWWRSGPRIGPVTPEALGLSPTLVTELGRWHDDWETDAEGRTEDQFVDEGRRLAQRIADELPDVEVVYDDT